MPYHVPVMLRECIEGLNIKPDGCYVDLTFGGGGHAKAILEKLGRAGRLIVFDQDTDVLENLPQDQRVIFVHSNFRYMRNFLEYHEEYNVDGILADLGISSHQVDQVERGFSYMSDTSLDMRMNSSSKTTAAEILNTYSEDELNRIFREYGEITRYKNLSKKILELREHEKITSTSAFITGIKSLLPPGNRFSFLARIFQALRVEVNDELGALRDMLEQIPDYLVKGGRVVILSYHSLEDRIVKNFFRSGNAEGIIEKDFFGNVITPFRVIGKNPLVPGADEINKNVRARSAKLRIAERI